MDGVDVWPGGLGFVSGGEGDVDRVSGDLSELLVHRYQEILQSIWIWNLIQIWPIPIFIYQMSKYQGRVDPLDLLRAVYTEDKKVRLKDKNLIFEKDVKIPIEQPTAWVSIISKKQYSVGSLWLFMEHHLKKINDYITKITQYGVENVTISDRQEISNFFLGKIKESSCISQEAKLNLAMKNNPQRNMPASGFQEEADPTKKIKTDPIQIQVLDQSYKFERPVMTKNRSLKCRESPNFSYASLLQILVNSQPSGNTAKTDEKKMRINMIVEKKKNPIIVVPENLHPGNLCLGNIEKFLQKGAYEETTGNIGFKQWIQFEHALGKRKVRFEVTNNPKTLLDEDWKCVVAVFIQGRAGQFKEWRKNNPQQLFHLTKGFLLRFPTKDSNVAVEWNVKTLTLDKNLRYRDSEISKTIWKDIESFLYEKV